MDSTISSGSSFFGRGSLNLDPAKPSNGNLISAYSNGDPYDNIKNLSLNEQIAIAQKKINLNPKKPRVIYFYVGINEYNHENDPVNPINKLNYSQKDVSDAKDLFSRDPEDLVFYITNAKATKANIMRIFNFIAENNKKEDLFICALSGHGYFDPDESDQAYIVPHDGDLADVGKDNPCSLISTKNLVDVFCGKKDAYAADTGNGRVTARFILLIDACDSGALIGKAVRKEFAEGAKVVRPGSSASSAADTGANFGAFVDRAYVQTATRSNEKAFEIREVGNGALFAAVRIALGKAGKLGLADFDHDRDIRCKGELDIFLKVAVKRLEYIVPITRYDYSLIVPPEGSYDIKIPPTKQGLPVDINEIYTEEEKKILTKKLRADGFLPGQVVTVLDRMKKVYSRGEIEYAKTCCRKFGLGHYIDADNPKVKDLWLISLIIDGYSEENQYWRFVEAFPVNECGARFEITKALNYAEKRDFRIQTPSYIDNYPSRNDPEAADLIIKTGYVNIHERQKKADKGIRGTNMNPIKP